MITQYLEKLLKAESLEEAWTVHTEKMASFGFDRLSYGASQFQGGKFSPNPLDWILLSSYDPAFTERYMSEKLYFTSPMFIWALTSKGARSWGEKFEDHPSSEKQATARRIEELNQRFEMFAGYSISLSTVCTRATGIVSMAARRDLSQDDIDAVWAKHGAEITSLTHVAHLKILALPRIGQRALTDRQREVLVWVDTGKTVQEIAEILHLTPPTVEKHLRLAREALEVQTTAQALSKASFGNYLTKAESLSQK